MATLLVAFLLTADVGSDVIVRDTVDIIEVNHVYDEHTGRKRLSQTIFLSLIHISEPTRPY